VFGGDLLHELDGGAIGHRLGHLIPAGILLGTEIRAVENFLQAQDLNLLFGGLLDQLQVLVNHGLLDLFQRVAGAKHVGGLNQSAADVTRHRHLTEAKLRPSIYSRWAGKC